MGAKKTKMHGQPGPSLAQAYRSNRVAYPVA